MAQQITIDIVAETKKLTSGINDANGQIDGMSNKLKGAAAAAGAAASAFVLKQGITFLKQGIDEAKEAQEVMRGATTTFGEGSDALKKITADADAFGKAIAVDNDEIIKLSTQLGSRLPADAKALSAELINTAYDIEAYTAGAVTAEAVSTKLAKAFADGELSAKELTKIFPDLSDATYAQAEALSKAGKNQEALSLLNDAAQKKYGDAAEKNVTSTQKFEVALANFKETLGTKVLPILEKGIDFLTKVIDAFDNLPGPVQNVVLALGAVVAIGGPLLTFLASAKTAMITLGIVTKAQTGSQIALNTAMLANPIGIVIIAIAAIIAIGVLLWKNWDTITEYAGKLWGVIKNVFYWIKDNWQLLLGFLTGPIGAAIGLITKNFDKIKEKAIEIVNSIKDIFDDLPSKMFTIGRNIVTGLWNGISGLASWLKNRVFDFFGDLIPGWAKKMLGISSPSKVFAKFGEQIVQGLALGIDTAKNLAEAATTSLGNSTIGGFGNLNTQGIRPLSSAGAVNITINAGIGTDPYVLGREVNNALAKYGKVSRRVTQV
jgi:tetratricopeptide (TPR) repeat protein